MAEGRAGPTLAEMGITQKDLGVAKPNGGKPEAISDSDARESSKPGFIKEFSKKHDSARRAELAGEIRAERKVYFDRQKGLKGQRAEQGEEVDTKEINLAKQAKRLQQLEDQLTRLSESWFGRAWNFFKIRGLRSKAKTTQEGYEKALQESNTQKELLEAVTEELVAPGVPPEFEQARRMVNSFYAGQKEKWANTPYNKEDLVHYFSENHLAKLTLAEYALLLKRFPGEMVAHVTRQGIRDHLGHGDHTLGLDQFVASFVEILKDMRLKSPFGVHLEEGLKEEAVARCLGLGVFIHSREQAEGYLRQILRPTGGPSSYADKLSVHFAAEEVADLYYGSEKGNEIFFAFPSVYIASQFYFLASTLVEGSRSYWNDQWVLSRDGQGMDLNSGLIFIPKSALVDRQTGSRYKLNQELNPVVNKRYIDTINRVVESEEFDKFSAEVDAIQIEHEEQINDILRQKMDDFRFQYGGQELKHRLLELQTQTRSQLAPLLSEKLKPYIDLLQGKFDITDQQLIDVLTDHRMLARLQQGKESVRKGYTDPFGKPYTLDFFASECLRNKAILFELAENPISSQEYWESYFQTYPDLKPARVVYYEGDDPTRTLQQWKRENGIVNRAKGEKDRFGFEEHYASSLEGEELEKTLQEVTGFDPTRFESIAREVIDKYFPENKQEKDAT